MVSCEVSGCNSSDENSQNSYTYHTFPRNKDIRRKWLKLLNRKNWNPKQNSTICSKHFDKSCFTYRGQNARLLSVAIPTLFMPSPEQSSPDDNDAPNTESHVHTIERLRARSAALEHGTKALEARIKVLERQNKMSQDSLGVLKKLNEGLARRCLHMEKKNEKLRIRMRATGTRYSSDEDDESDELPRAKRTNPASFVDDDSGAEDVGKRPRHEAVNSESKLKNFREITNDNNTKIDSVSYMNKTKKRSKPSASPSQNQPLFSPIVETGSSSTSPLVLIDYPQTNSPLVKEIGDVPSTSSYCVESNDPLSLLSSDGIKIEESEITIEEHDVAMATRVKIERD